MIPASHFSALGADARRIPRRPGRLRVAAGAALVGCAALATGRAQISNVTWKVDVSVKETYDSNVYLQDADPAPANVAAARAAGLEPVTAQKDSFVTSIQPRLNMEYKPCAEFKAGLSYTPDLAFYHNAHSEDYQSHVFGANFSGAVKSAVWDLKNTFTWIDGNREGPTFARPGDIPAIGGIPLRNRRAAFIYRNNFRVTEPIGEKFILRPVVSTYVHDFKTNQRFSTNTAAYQYENYIDRQDINGGVDAGYKLTEKATVLLGYRYGRQDQYRAPTSVATWADSPYDSTYHRILVGLEGALTEWLKITASFGPDLRDYSDRARQTYPAFDDNELLWYVDAGVTLQPTAHDTVTLLHRRYQQPAFSSFSVYEDITYDIAYRHAFSSKWTAGAGFTLYLGDWQAPVNREDWIYTPSVFLSFAITDKLSAEASYSYDWVESQVPNTTGREYTRHLVALGARYLF